MSIHQVVTFHGSVYEASNQQELEDMEPDCRVAPEHSKLKDFVETSYMANTLGIQLLKADKIDIVIQESRSL